MWGFASLAECGLSLFLTLPGMVGVCLSTSVSSGECGGWGDFRGSLLPHPQPLTVELSRFRRLHYAGS